MQMFNYFTYICHIIEYINTSLFASYQSYKININSSHNSDPAGIKRDRSKCEQNLWIEKYEKMNREEDNNRPDNIETLNEDEEGNKEINIAKRLKIDDRYF